MAIDDILTGVTAKQINDTQYVSGQYSFREIFAYAKTAVKQVFGYSKGVGNKQVSTNYKKAATIAATLCFGTVLGAYGSGDGSDEPGFVGPPKNREQPKAPPRTISSAETTDPCCCCPVTPQARTEAKRPPQPPVLITKLKSETK